MPAGVKAPPPEGPKLQSPETGDPGSLEPHLVTQLPGRGREVMLKKWPQQEKKQPMTSSHPTQGGRCHCTDQDHSDRQLATLCSPLTLARPPDTKAILLSTGLLSISSLLGRGEPTTAVHFSGKHILSCLWRDSHRAVRSRPHEIHQHQPQGSG